MKGPVFTLECRRVHECGRWHIRGRLEKLEGCSVLGSDLMQLQNIVYHPHSPTSVYRELTCSYYVYRIRQAQINSETTQQLAAYEGVQLAIAS